MLGCLFNGRGRGEREAKCEAVDGPWGFLPQSNASTTIQGRLFLEMVLSAGCSLVSRTQRKFIGYKRL
jgi:hypothetical protein